MKKPEFNLNSQCFDKNVEEEWYKFWEQSNFFTSSINTRKEPYVILMPPPNITGILHMGHLLNVTIQDILARRARMLNKEVCWVPGTDHASIATEVKVIQYLKTKGIEKKSLSKEEFLEHCWEWKERHEKTIIQQLKRIGISCDWKRKKFTLDEKLSLSVTKTFVDFYEKGYIYKGNRMVNWDCYNKTAISDDEVMYKEVHGKLYYIKYLLSGSGKHVLVATTRPETIMGDTALCVNPHDERYQEFIGKNAIVPLINKVIPIIADNYVSKDFGTGCLKVTPAHDINDADIGLRHNLETINIFNEDGTLNINAKIFVGQNRFEARKNIVETLTKYEFLEKIEDYTHNIGFSERTNEIIEPRISTQWFLKLENFIKPALENVLNGNIKFYPKKYINLFKVWMEKAKDWCISRQLWWGHQIPAYYLPDGSFVVALDKQTALQKAKKNLENVNLTLKDLVQDNDVLDTWFSSALWPITVWDGINKPDNEEIKYYYPTNDLVTAPEIIFFWVARMIMMGYKIQNDKPFKNVYFTGIVRDKQKRKMSKSLGNSPDLMKLIDQYGVDGVRAGIIFSSPAGNDLIFTEKLCEQGRNFTNKIWNAFKLIQTFSIDTSDIKKKDFIIVNWFEAVLNKYLIEIEKLYDNFKISEILIRTYKLFYDNFCSIYLEVIKLQAKNKIIYSEVYNKTVLFFENIVKIIHPFMPFITENIWQQLKDRKYDESIVVTSWPKVDNYDVSLIENGNKAFELVSKIRNFKKEKNILNKTKLEIKHCTNSKWFSDFEDIISFLTNSEFLSQSTIDIQSNPHILYIDNESYYIFNDNLNVLCNIDEKDKILQELQYNESFLKIIDDKLSNNMFIENAPKKIIEKEKKKRHDTFKKIATLKKNLKKISSKDL